MRYGYWRVRVLFEREGWNANYKLLSRVYREQGLTLQRKHPKCHVSMVVHREVGAQPTGPYETWSMYFIADQLVQGTQFRALTVVDNFTKECLAIEVGQSFMGEYVVATLKRIAAKRGVPKMIFCDNGSEFVRRGLERFEDRCNRN